jgi:hypothetical protein
VSGQPFKTVSSSLVILFRLADIGCSPFASVPLVKPAQRFCQRSAHLIARDGAHAAANREIWGKMPPASTRAWQTVSAVPKPAAC